jgi:hypothetical protein
MPAPAKLQVIVPDLPSPPPVTGEHIFPASYLEPLALKWKDLNARGKHTEAMAVLEEIVVGSSQMFKRLAQHEGYHYTVSLDILVSAAQEKVIRWLLRWQRKKGKLFAWFSKSLSGDSRVLLADGSLRRIDEIVAKRAPVSVVTWDEAARNFTTRAVTDWIVSEARREDWRKVSVRHPAGFNRVLFATFDHEFQTQRGWIAVDALRPNDRLCLHAPQLTGAGVEAVVGMYLGDGHINAKHALVVGHGRKQKFYVDHLADKFNKTVYDGECMIRGKHYYSNSVCIPLRSIWPKCKELARRKTITPFVLSHLTPIALAYWFMDDGSFDVRRGAIKLATDGFTREECLSLKTALEFKFGIVSHYHLRKNKNYGYLQILAESRSLFFSLIGPYVLEGFRYKMPSSWAGRMGPACCPELVFNERLECSFVKRRIIGHTNTRCGRSGPGSWFTPDFSKKYDITVPGTRNFVAEGIVVHNCAKNAFRSELVKVNNIRKHLHFTSDNLEKFFGSVDHTIDRLDIAAEVRAKLARLTCRWGNPQEIGAIHFIIECILEEDDHEKQAAIRGAAYAYGISMDLAKFFYSWAVVAMRDQMYKKVRVPFTEEDLVRSCYSYTEFVSLFDMENTPFTWPVHGKYLVANYGGRRMKIPTIAQISELVEKKQIFDEVEASEKDPDSVAEVGQRHGKNARSAQDSYNEMVEILDPRRSGEFDVYGSQTDSE